MKKPRLPSPSVTYYYLPVRTFLWTLLSHIVVSLINRNVHGSVIGTKDGEEEGYLLIEYLVHQTDPE
ncbi:uncharacterized protein PHALS_03008 [Plasmopara halstedii]|uniref:Uncharacterized protein n=1 Tax=Plasmopara halstedii TaxID=4781 RepID=A0A0P1A767_PLAHL|nr:uncharacterized protein PHALS_03008 [Plasmopara halstedii]CEG36458.1 hypothetical protein PHALS_03008 [Plasmopara halstedii]|eukprot:XP_024572827.1 hypothetical protein PHALS_03008 [Plasmopara halstedii]